MSTTSLSRGSPVSSSFDPDDDPFVGGSPLAGALSARYRRPKRHDHAGHMVWPADTDGVCRHCWCAECGQEWEMAYKDGPNGEREVAGWRPIPLA